MLKNSPSQIHHQAEREREKDHHLKALKLYEEAIIGYQKVGNYQGIAGALQGEFLAYKHLYLKTKDLVFLIIGEKTAMASFSIIKEKKIGQLLGSSYFRLGEAAMLFGDFRQAINYFQLALDNYHGTKTERGDYLYHLGEAWYRNGEKEKGKRIMLEGLKEIQTYKDEVDSFLCHVWESGCLLKLADLLKLNEPVEARKYLQEAKEIINQDKRLIIRKRQLDNLIKLLNI